MNITKQKTAIIIVTSILSILLIGASVFGCFYYNINRSNSTDNTANTNIDTEFVVESSFENGIAIAFSEAENDNTYRLTASVFPYDSMYKSLEWSIEFNEADSFWADGKTVTDYVTLTIDEKKDNICDVTLLQAFGEQIIVKCYLAERPDMFATVTVDYIAKENVRSVGLQILSSKGNDTNYYGRWKVDVLNDADTYTLIPRVFYEDEVYSMGRDEDVEVFWQISEKSNGLMGDARNVIKSYMSGKYNLSMVQTLPVHYDTELTLSLDLLCGDIFSDRFTQVSTYYPSDVDGAKNCMRNAVLEALNYSATNYVITVTVVCGKISETFDIFLGNVDVTI